MSERRKFTGYEKEAVYERYNGQCAICGRHIGRKHMVISKTVPLSKGGDNWIENLLLTCKSCSKMKADFYMDDFYRKIGEVFFFHEDEIAKAIGNKDTIFNNV